jgi:hypothetical protein
MPKPVSQKFSTSANFPYGYGPISPRYISRYWAVAARYFAASASSFPRRKASVSTSPARSR